MRPGITRALRGISHGAILLPLLGAALFWVLLLHGSAPTAEAQALPQPAPAQIVKLHLGAYLFWHESSGADGYEIQTRSQSGGTWGSWSSISYTGTTQPATVTGLSAGTKYQWRVRATSGSEQSEWSTHSDDDAPAYNWTAESFGRNIANPAVLQSAEAGDPGEVTVTWTHGPARSGATITGWRVGYRLFSEPVDQTRETSPLPASATTATVTGLTGGEQYEFWVRPYVGGVPGRTSNALEATPTTTTTLVPTPTPVPTQSSDATLQALSVSAGSISPAFSSTTYAYTVSVAAGVTSTTVTPTVNHSDATVTVNGTMVASGNPSASIALTVGANAITVQVTAENGGTQNYIVTITRQSGNANLSGLLASTATSRTATYSGQTLTPAFAAGTTAYGATVGNARTHARVTPTVADPNATVRVGKRGATPATVTSGTASAPIALNVGANEIVMRVTAQDTSITQDYTVTITRQPRSAVDGTPPAPSGLTITPCPHCLSATWTAPAVSVDGYHVHYTTKSADDLADDAEIGYYQHPRVGRIINRHPGRGWVALPTTHKEPKYGMGYLQPGQEYRVRVRAYNSDGAGPWAVGKGTPLEARRTVTLSASAERVREGDPVTITATVRYNGRPTPIQEDMDVLLKTHLGTAEAGDLGTLQQISIGKYTASASATIQTNRDSDSDDETFAVLIHKIPKRNLARAGDPDIVWVTITEGDPSLPEPVTARESGQAPAVIGAAAPPEQEAPAAPPTAVTLSLDALTVSESAGQVTVTATLDAPAPAGGIGGFLLAGPDGTASPDVDYSMPLGIFIPGGQRSGTAAISITDDEVVEASETIVISALFDLGTTVLEDTITLTIGDDDTANPPASDEDPPTNTVAATDPDDNPTDNPTDTPEENVPVPETTLPGLAARYDVGGDGEIDGSDYQHVKHDWISGKISYEEFLEVVRVHLRSA